MSLEEIARIKLKYAIERFGSELCYDYSRTEGILRDLCGKNKLEINLIIAAQKEGAAVELYKKTHDVPIDSVIENFIFRMKENQGISEDLSRWAIESWASALGFSCNNLQSDVIASCGKYEEQINSYCRKVIGIDLGTSTSSVAITVDGEPIIIPGGQRIPTVIAITESNKLIFGEQALKFAINHPESTFYSFQSLIGSKFDSAYVNERSCHLPYNIVNGSNGYTWLESAYTLFSPIEITAFMLMHLKRIAEDYLEESVLDVVISVPDCFDMVQRKAVEDAGKIAGLNVLRLISNAAAAALAYGLDRIDTEKIAVIDFGAGSLDIAILELGDGVYEVKSKNGILRFGGDVFDEVIIEWLLEALQKEHGINLRGNRNVFYGLKVAAEKARYSLTESIEPEIDLSSIYDAAYGHTLPNLKLSDSVLANLLDLLENPCTSALKEAGLTTREIDNVILIGGMSHMPAVRKRIEQLFNTKINVMFDGECLVAKGAAIHGGVLCGDIKDVLLLDATALSFGIRTSDGTTTQILQKNTTIPCRISQIFSTTEDNQTTFSIIVLQGDSEILSSSVIIGNLDLVGIPVAQRGLPQIEVTFDIDANGRIHVTAKDLGTGKEESISITGFSGLSKEDIDKMERDAENFAYCQV